MDVMQIRRMLMSMIGGTDMGAWKQKQITANNTYGNALDIKNWLESELPTGSQYMVVIDSWDQTGYVENQLICLRVDVNNGNNSFQFYVRKKSNLFNIQQSYTTNYDLCAMQGDSYTIFYQ